MREDAAVADQDQLFHFFVTTNKASNNKNKWFQILECVIN